MITRFTAVLFVLAAVVGGDIAHGAQERPQVVTAPLAMDRPLSRIVFGSCADQQLPQPFWAPIIEAAPDLLLMMGDNVYGDVSSAEMTELKDAYARLADVAGFQRLIDADIPILSVWDDHDYGRNDGGGDFEYKYQSARLFRTFWDIAEDSPRGRREGIYDAVIVGPQGQRVQIILLDTRFFRSALRRTDEWGAPGRERYVADPDPDKTMLGSAQWLWLAEQLRQPADLRLVVSSIQVISDAHGFEKWGNLPRERERLFRLIDDTNANGAIFLSGDRHRGGIYLESEAVDYPLYEVTSSSLNRPTRFEVTEVDPSRISGDMVVQANFGVLMIDWQDRRLTLELRDGGGSVVRSLELALSDLASAN